LLWDVRVYVQTLVSSYGFETILLNQIPEEEKDLHEIARFIKSLPITYKNTMKAIPEFIREHVEKALNKYIDGFFSSYEQFLNSDGKERKTIAQHLYRYYWIDF